MTVDFENDLLLVTIASGRQATSLLPHLVKQWKRLRLNVSSASSKDRLEKQYPNAEVTLCDLSDANGCVKLLEGVTVCYMLTPAFHPQEARCGYNIIDAALANINKGGSFKHMLHSSVINNVLRKLINHDEKRYIEEYLIESGLPYTIIQPAHLMEMFDLSHIMNNPNPVHIVLWNPATRFSFVSTRDVGEAAALILANPEKHMYATYQLVGTPSPISYNDVRDIVSAEIGKEVTLEQKSIEEGVELMTGMFSTGKGKEVGEVPFVTKQAVARLLMYYGDKGLVGNANVLEMLLGRKPLDYRDWVRLSIGDVKASKV